MMYEAEVNDLIESIDSIPVDIRRRFEESRRLIRKRTTLPWGEHCTECNWPVCYTTCELYSPRTDGGCRLFVNGTVRIDHRDPADGHLVKIQFKRWGKLWTVGNLELAEPPEAIRKERANIRTGAIARALPWPSPLRRRVLQKVSYRRRVAAENAPPSAELPDCFMCECYNPNAQTITVTVTIKPRGQASPAFQRMLCLEPGFTRERIAFSEISGRLDTSRLFEIEIVPNESDNTVLYFGLLDFVKESRIASDLTSESDGTKWKCLVWDLDNTLWDGTLIEDGPDQIRVRQDVIEVIKETDRRGILHSIASKNNHDDAFRVLQRYGLDEYFLYPQINWLPKSDSIARIAKLLNIGADSIAFVDDQPFEREEVRSAMPQVALIDAAESATIPSRRECLVPVTEESRQRRVMYRLQEQRDTILKTHNGDYTGFLKECNIRLDVEPLSDANLERVYELAQRTNQMNFSGNRYPREQLAEMIALTSRDTHVIRCADRFGSYGIVGFAVVDPAEPRLLDLMFSCRVQSKRVEHAFLSFLLKRFVETESLDFYANYRRTPKNAPSGGVFEEMGFDVVDQSDGMTSLVFRRSRAVPDDRIISMSVAGAE